MTVVVGAREDFTLEAFRRVTIDGEGVIIGPAALRVMGEARAGFERLLRSDPRGFIYGVTTRPGVEVGTAIPPEELREYARRFRGWAGASAGIALMSVLSEASSSPGWPTSSAGTPRCGLNSPSVWPPCWTALCRAFPSTGRAAPGRSFPSCM